MKKRAVLSVLGWLLVCTMLAVPALWCGITYGKPLAEYYWNAVQANTASTESPATGHIPVAFVFPAATGLQGVESLRSRLQTEQNYSGIVPAVSLHPHIAVCEAEPQLEYIDSKDLRTLSVAELPDPAQRTSYYQAFIKNGRGVSNAGNQGRIFFNELVYEHLITITQGRAIDTTTVYDPQKPAEIIVSQASDVDVGTEVWLNLGIYDAEHLEFFIPAVVVGKARVNEALPPYDSYFGSPLLGDTQENTSVMFIQDVSAVYDVFSTQVQGLDLDREGIQKYLLSYADAALPGIADETLIAAARESGAGMMPRYTKQYALTWGIKESLLFERMTALCAVSTLTGAAVIVLFFTQTAKIGIRYKKQKQKNKEEDIE